MPIMNVVNIPQGTLSCFAIHLVPQGTLSCFAIHLVPQGTLSDDVIHLVFHRVFVLEIWFHVSRDFQFHITRNQIYSATDRNGGDTFGRVGDGFEKQDYHLNNFRV